ncbi:MAG: hypothetical protein IJ583_11600 [Firmicutes bacterium]|nr:hypothetical protein [Bacillota bacterium]
MSMVVNTNTTALTAYRMLSVNSKKTSVTSARLSSGKKINQAADDAAGLAISEKMTSQIRGLDMAYKNAQDGISLLQVADGGLSEVSNMMQRMRELAVQAANDTNTDEDRQKIQKEVDQLIEEIDRTGQDTEYNEIKVLLQNGPLPRTTVTTSTQSVTEVTYLNTGAEIPYIKGGVPGTMGTIIEGQKSYLVKGAAYGTVNGANGQAMDISNMASYTLDFSGITSSTQWAELDGCAFTFNCSRGCKQEFTFVFNNSSTGISDSTTNANVRSAGTENNKVFQVGTADYQNGSDFVGALRTAISSIDADSHVGHDNIIGFSDDLKSITISGSLGGGGDDGWVVAGKPTVATVDKEVTSYQFDYTKMQPDLILHIGANKDQILELDMPYITAGELGIGLLDVTTHDSAEHSIKGVDYGLNKVAVERARMGAYMNRLEYISNNLQVSSENLSAARSRIEDADIAKEMMVHTRMNVLNQAAVSMLAQSNASQQSVLQLFG